MISLLNNREVRRVLLLEILISVVAVIAVFNLHPMAGFIVIGFSVLMIVIYLISTYNRYKRISALAEDINKLLHGDNSINIGNYSEGELSILHSEIYKMTIRLREQQNQLINDKIYLADSLADISHQIRTPLTSVNLLVSFISEPDISDERREKLSRDLYSLLSRMEWLIVSLLKISKLSLSKSSMPI